MLTSPLLAILIGAVVGGGAFLFIIAIRGLPPRPAAKPSVWLEDLRRDVFGVRGLFALLGAVLILLDTRWVVAAVGAALLILFWSKLSGGAGGERAAIARLEGLATWTESLRDTIAGAVGLEQAIPASLRAAAPALRDPLIGLVDRLHTRVPLAAALRRFADDINDPSADLILAALIINSRLRGPGLRDLLGALSGAVREELDMRRRIEAQRRSTRFSAMFVVGFSVGVAALLTLFNHKFVQVYGTLNGQLMLLVVAALYAAGFFWLTKLAKFDVPERILIGQPSQVPSEVPETVGKWQGGAG
ncbi:MAG TPA: type II secretion system F family protein [Streptosporangiaceae bacterium]|jgi:Flp pilus assembly protein TadB